MGLTELIANGLDVSGGYFNWDSLPVVERKVVLVEPKTENFLYMTNKEMKSILNNSFVKKVEENTSCYGIIAHIQPFTIKYAANFGREPTEMMNGCRILLRTRGKGPMVKFFHHRHQEKIHNHDNVRSNGGVCLGNLEKPISNCLKQKEYAVALSLLIEFIQVFNGI